jgi:hypothetical protein
VSSRTLTDFYAQLLGVDTPNIHDGEHAAMTGSMVNTKAITAHSISAEGYGRPEPGALTAGAHR